MHLVVNTPPFPRAQLPLAAYMHAARPTPLLALIQGVRSPPAQLNRQNHQASATPDSLCRKSNPLLTFPSAAPAPKRVPRRVVSPDGPAASAASSSDSSPPSEPLSLPPLLLLRPRFLAAAQVATDTQIPSCSAMLTFCIGFCWTIQGTQVHTGTRQYRQTHIDTFAVHSLMQILPGLG